MVNIDAVVAIGDLLEADTQPSDGVAVDQDGKTRKITDPETYGVGEFPINSLSDFTTPVSSVILLDTAKLYRQQAELVLVTARFEFPADSTISWLIANNAINQLLFDLNSTALFSGNGAGAGSPIITFFFRDTPVIAIGTNQTFVDFIGKLSTSASNFLYEKGGIFNFENLGNLELFNNVQIADQDIANYVKGFKLKNNEIVTIKNMNITGKAGNDDVFVSIEGSLSKKITIKDLELKLNDTDAIINIKPDIADDANVVISNVIHEGGNSKFFKKKAEAPFSATAAHDVASLVILPVVNDGGNAAFVGTNLSEVFDNDLVTHVSSSEPSYNVANYEVFGRSGVKYNLRHPITKVPIAFAGDPSIYPIASTTKTRVTAARTTGLASGIYVDLKLDNYTPAKISGPVLSTQFDLSIPFTGPSEAGEYEAEIGDITAVADAGAVNAIASVSTSGDAVFDKGSALVNVQDGDIMVHSTFTPEVAYNVTGIVLGKTANTYRLLLADGSVLQSTGTTDSGSGKVSLTQFTSRSHNQPVGKPIKVITENYPDLTGSIRSIGAETSPSTFTMRTIFISGSGSDTGTWNTNSLDHTDPRVNVSNSSNSSSKNIITVKVLQNTSISFTPTTSFAPYDVGVGGSIVGKGVQRWQLIDAQKMRIRYIGLTPFDGMCNMVQTLLSNGSETHTFTMRKFAGGIGTGVTFEEESGPVQLNAEIVVPYNAEVQAVFGDEFEPNVKQASGTNPLNVRNVSFTFEE